MGEKETPWRVHVCPTSVWKEDASVSHRLKQDLEAVSSQVTSVQASSFLDLQNKPFSEQETGGQGCSVTASGRNGG